jgi:hypothetical protein
VSRIYRAQAKNQGVIKLVSFKQKNTGLALDEYLDRYNYIYIYLNIA